jgi:hypothetical protein
MQGPGRTGMSTGHGCPCFQLKELVFSTKVVKSEIVLGLSFSVPDLAFKFQIDD